uniref:Uncharacterized protein n=1 Tax=Pristionchus pacificus TaxID=54126 RepID=A0A2A6B8P8_PRIPA|eukprot:PDM62237.1 hypothetical protein PRIPAC_51679 [Pristionchus pacificus]
MSLMTPVWPKEISIKGQIEIEDRDQYSFITGWGLKEARFMADSVIIFSYKSCRKRDGVGI